MNKIICGHCKGTGQVPDGYCLEPCVECPTCDGTGIIIQLKTNGNKNE